MTELFRRSAVDLAGMIRAREISARELLDSCLARIEAVNPDLNAIVTLVPEIAHERAVAADQAIADGDALGPLHGLPVAHKDLELTAGIRTTMGSPLFAEFVPEEDGLIAQRMRAAGAVVVGKTNTPEFGAGSHTFNEVFGRTMNPYDLSRTCGGSSGGAAVALAADMIPIADGSDMGGSLRNPAAFCNVVGLRPSYGRVPSWPNRTPWSGLGTSGVLARTVDDLALADAGGRRAGCPGADLTARARLGLRDARRRRPGGSTGRVDRRPRAADRGRGQGRAGVRAGPTRVARLSCRARRCPTCTMPVRSSRRCGHGTSRSRPGDSTTPTTTGSRTPFGGTSRRPAAGRCIDHASATVAHAALIERVRTFFDDYDVLALPTTQVVPFDIDARLAADRRRRRDGELHRLDAGRAPTSRSPDVPAISMPAAFTPDGLPVGVQFVGRPRGDVELLRFARLWERSVAPDPHDGRRLVSDVHKNVQRVIDAGEALGVEVEPRHFPAGAKTAQDAADAIGCDVGQIVKSLIFGVDGEVVLAYVSGSNQLDESRLAAAAGGERCERVDADAVRGGDRASRSVACRRSATRRKLPVFVDPDLLGHDEVWAAAGTWNDVFPLDPPSARGGERRHRGGAQARHDLAARARRACADANGSPSSSVVPTRSNGNTTSASSPSASAWSRSPTTGASGSSGRRPVWLDTTTTAT